MDGQFRHEVLGFVFVLLVRLFELDPNDLVSLVNQVGWLRRPSPRSHVFPNPPPPAADWGKQNESSREFIASLPTSFTNPDKLDGVSARSQTVELRIGQSITVVA